MHAKLKTMQNKVIFLGDTHTLKIVPKLLLLGALRNYTLIHVGDCGEGIKHPKEDKAALECLYLHLEEYDSKIIICRGNHANPAFYQKNHWANLEFGTRIEFISDYETRIINNHTFQFIGGAISIDRRDRIANRNWWASEIFQYKPELARKVDVLVTHSAPSYCPPEQFSPLVYDWANADETLLKELKMERHLIGEIVLKCDPYLHVYGHFHASTVKVLNGCLHKQLNIYELWSPSEDFTV